MKRKLFLSLSVAVAAMFMLMSTSLIMAEKATVKEAADKVSVANFVSCPNGPVTVQGCVSEVDGCFYIATTNGRTIAIGIVDQGVGAGDEISITGNWQTDADCAPCVLNATSVTDLGDCN